MPVKTNQTTHQDTAGKENMPAFSNWPSAGLLTSWPLTGGSESCGSVTGECEMPQAEAILSCSAREQTCDFKGHKQRKTNLFHDMFSFILQDFCRWRRKCLCDMSQVMPELSPQRFLKMRWKRCNIFETQESTKIKHKRKIKLWTSEACCPHLHAWLTLHIHECMSGSLSQLVSMKGHLQMCESVTHYVAWSSSLNEQILTNAQFRTESSKTRVKKDPETASLPPVQAEAINSFHLRLPDFQHVKTPKA